MPNIKSAKKRVLVEKRNAARNKSEMTAVKTAIKKINNAIDTNKIEEAEQLLPATMSAIDSAVTKGIMHKNTAANKKSAIAKRISDIKSGKLVIEIKKDNKTIAAEKARAAKEAREAERAAFAQKQAEAAAAAEQAKKEAEEKAKAEKKAAKKTKAKKEEEYFSSPSFNIAIYGARLYALCLFCVVFTVIGFLLFYIVPLNRTKTNIKLLRLFPHRLFRRETPPLPNALHGQ